MNPFILRAPSTIHFGENASGKVGEEAKRFGAKKALIITDPFLSKSGAVDPIAASVKAAGIACEIYAGVDKEPTLEHVDGCLKAQKEGGCDLLISVGGGSPIDVGKAVSFMATNPGAIQDYMGVGKVGIDALPLFAVPTTAGTGSEVTATTIIADTVKNVKMLIISPRIIPKVALVDPLLTLGMPKGLTAATGLDALTHAIEAFVSQKAQPISDLYALAAVELLSGNLQVAWNEPGNVEARTRTLLGALLAGLAFSNASVALVHGMSRPIGALFHVAHGVSNAALLGEVMDFSLSGNYARYAKLAITMGLPDLGDDKKTAQSGADRVRQLIKDLEVPTLTGLGVTKEKLTPVVSKMADDAIASGSPANNPRLATKEEIIALYMASL